MSVQMDESQMQDMATKIVEFKLKIKEVSSTIKERTEQHDNFEDYTVLNKKAKALKKEIDSDDEIAKLKDLQKTFKEDMKLAMIALSANMEEMGKDEIEIGGGVKLVKVPSLSVQTAKTEKKKGKGGKKYLEDMTDADFDGDDNDLDKGLKDSFSDEEDLN